MAISPLLPPGAAAASPGISRQPGLSASLFRVKNERRDEDRITISEEARKLAGASPARKPKLPDDFELRTLTQKLAQGSQIRAFLTRAFESNL
jgi:hypothetical protein